MLHKRQTGQLLVSCEPYLVVLGFLLPEKRNAAGQTGKTKDLITDDYDLLGFYELRTLGILINASVIKPSPASIFGSP